MTAAQFIETLDQMRVRLFLELHRGRFTFGYRAEPGFEGCFAALAKHFDVVAHHDDICDALLWMGRLEDRRAIGLTADGTRVFAA
jgi:hypothetical protein